MPVGGCGEERVRGFSLHTKGGFQRAVPHTPVQEGQAAGAGGEQEKAREQAGHGCGAGVRWAGVPGEGVRRRAGALRNTGQAARRARHRAGDAPRRQARTQGGGEAGVVGEVDERELRRRGGRVTAGQPSATGRLRPASRVRAPTPASWPVPWVTRTRLDRFTWTARNSWQRSATSACPSSSTWPPGFPGVPLRVELSRRARGGVGPSMLLRREAAGAIATVQKTRTKPRAVRQISPQRSPWRAGTQLRPRGLQRRRGPTNGPMKG